MIEALSMHVKGVVQGVGFRPFVYRTAMRFHINGWVLNATDGVHIHAEGDSKMLDKFIMEISERPPQSAQVKSIDMLPTEVCKFQGFEIRFSDDAEVEETTLVSADLATCEHCVQELFDPENRRYRYPFINCTDCGPRFTIIDSLPYDRPATSMAEFEMCPECAAEYADPYDRRFHAQPDACFECGPALSWSLAGSDEVRWAGNREESDAIIAEAVAMLRDGKIIAVKGLGGFHLVCDASNEEAIATLRQRKRRQGKAFACMVSSVEEAKKYCKVTDEEALVLQQPSRPIVLMKKRADVQLTPGLADNLVEFGLMLPATPLQHLLLHDFGGMLVMTSGNIHDEPIQTDDDSARRVLAKVADAFLGNNRKILARYDDSVVRLIKAGSAGYSMQTIRRARGMAPQPIPMPEVLGLTPQDVSVFATGPEQKNTFCITRGDQAFVSQHMGDMENVETYDAWLEGKATYQRLFDVEPTYVACDRHPEYLTTKWASKQDLSVFPVQHHHAHIVSAMAEMGVSGAVCGIAFDGTGYGMDKNIWGGEVLLCNLQAYERFANFSYVPMPGGAAAIKNPERMAYGLLWSYDLLEHPGAKSLLDNLGDMVPVLDQMIDQGLNTPFTSSVGRMFDAVSALLGVCTKPTYEGEGAVLLEAAIQGGFDADSEERKHVKYMGADSRYEVAVTKNVANKRSTALDTSVVLFEVEDVLTAILDDKAAGVPVSIIARRFHDSIVDAVFKSACLINQLYGITTVVLSGGVFMNRYVMEQSLDRLEQYGFTAVINCDLPPNDGCISYGQAVVAWAQQKNVC